jgi:hypothetical protein
MMILFYRVESNIIVRVLIVISITKKYKKYGCCCVHLKK